MWPPGDKSGSGFLSERGKEDLVLILTNKQIRRSQNKPENKPHPQNCGIQTLMEKKPDPIKTRKNKQCQSSVKL